jgi:hypothetical protein
MGFDRYSTLLKLKLQDGGHSFKLNATTPDTPANDLQQSDGQNYGLQPVAPGNPRAR